MNLRSKLFKKPWQHRDPEVRAEAVSQGQDPELKAALPQLAEQDDAPVVRLAALKRLNSEPFWLDARLKADEPEIVRAADHFLAREILRSDRADLEAARLEWLAQVGDADLLRRAAVSSPSTAIRRAALTRISAVGFLGDCYVGEADDSLAAEILERIDQLSTLERVVQAARHRSKRRSQAAAHRLEALKVRSGVAVAGQAASERLVQEIEILARGLGADNPEAQLAQLREQWGRVPDHPDALTRRFEGAARIIESAVRRSLDADDQQPEPASQAEPESVSEAAQPDDNLVASADFIRSSIRSGKVVAARDLLAHWDRSWNGVTAPGPADEALKADLLPLLRELQAQVQMKAKQQATPAGASASQDQGRVSFTPRLDEIAATLESGDLVVASEQIRKLRSEYDRLPARQRSSSDGGRLQRMEGRLKEMRNWQHWSNNKIRDELIAKVAQLAASGQHPDAIMAGLKQAREEWKRLEALEILPGDQRRFAAPPGQWRQFQAACKQAYTVSKPYFEKREQVLRDNLDTLQAFIKAGNTAATDEQSETSELLGFMRKARQAIRRMDDLPAKSRGASAAALRELMNTVSATLDRRFEAVESVKRRLVAEARALSHEKDLKAATDKAKALQTQWQKAGTGRRKVEQELWRAFREPIDPLFEQAKGEQDQRRQAERETHDELKALCQQAEDLAGLPDEELEGARGRLLGLIDEWLRHEGRPQALNQRFERAEQRFDKRMSEHQARLRQRADDRIGQLALLVQQLWTQRCEGCQDDLSDQLPGDPIDDPSGERLLALAGRIASPDFQPADLEQTVHSNSESGRQIAVEFEFLSGLETPAADQSLRMDYQVQRLARRMSERERQPDLASELEQLQRRWYESLPQRPEGYAEMRARIDKAQGILRGMIGH